jgi:acyl dehydratase
MRTHVDDLATMAGEELGVTDWVTVDQKRIDLFAHATGDHVDEKQAHDYLTLSMLPIFLEPFMEFDGVSMRLNYGLDGVRFPHPVPAGSRIRARVSVDSVEEKKRGVLVGMGCVIEVEGTDRPACVAQAVALLVRVGHGPTT